MSSEEDGRDWRQVDRGEDTQEGIGGRLGRGPTERGRVENEEVSGRVTGVTVG